jgi:hypothetical protein
VRAKLYRAKPGAFPKFVERRATMLYTVVGRLNGKEYRKDVSAHNIKEALELVIIQNVYEARLILGKGEIQWEVEEDFL